MLHHVPNFPTRSFRADGIVVSSSQIELPRHGMKQRRKFDATKSDYDSRTYGMNLLGTFFTVADSTVPKRVRI